jgi:hypothetical protein
MQLIERETLEAHGSVRRDFKPGHLRVVANDANQADSRSSK